VIKAVTGCPSMQRLTRYGEPVEGTPFGRYRLIELLGRGGMGEVWLAHDTAANNRRVAIKMLPPHLAADDMYVARFRREADLAAQLNNPHIIPIHNYGEIDGRLYVDMRLVEGRDLSEVLAEGALELGRAVRIIEQVAKALRAAHQIGLVHRDVKPSNILVDEDDFVYLIDFGIARGADQTTLTGPGTMIGSPHYMAPERFRAGDTDARADIYALACVLYECLTGSRPFPGESFESQITAHLMDPPPRPSRTDPHVPATLDPVVAKGMAKDPDQRYATTVDLARAAHNAITTPTRQEVPPPARPGTDVVRDASADTVEDRVAPQPADTVLDYPDTPPPQQVPGPTLDATRLATPPPVRGEPAPGVAGKRSSLQRPNRRTNVALVVGSVALVAVIAVVVAGHGDNPAPTTETSHAPLDSSSAPSSQASVLPVSDWVGSWSGPVTGDDRPYNIDLMLIADGQNLRGSVSYPQLGCNGTWTETSRNGNVREFRELIVKQGTCLNGVQIQVIDNGNSLSYQATSTSANIRAQLTRVS
jgi:serine/threonine protein kinase